MMNHGENCLHCDLLVVAMERARRLTCAPADMVDAAIWLLSDIVLFASFDLEDDAKSAERISSVMALVKHHLEWRNSRSERLAWKAAIDEAERRQPELGEP